MDFPTEDNSTEFEIEDVSFIDEEVVVMEENKPSENDELNFEDDCFEDFIEIADKEFNFDERESVEPNECNKSDSDILNNYLGDND